MRGAEFLVRDQLFVVAVDQSGQRMLGTGHLRRIAPTTDGRVTLDWASACRCFAESSMHTRPRALRREAPTRRRWSRRLIIPRARLSVSKSHLAW